MQDKIVEVKVEKAGVVVLHTFQVRSESSVAGFVQASIEHATSFSFEKEDHGMLQDLLYNGYVEFRYGDDWEYDVKALISDFDDQDIDPEFDFVWDKYTKCL